LLSRVNTLDSLYSGQTSLILQPYSARCPLCGTSLEICEQLRCSNCNFTIDSEVKLQKLVELAYDLLPDFYRMRIPLGDIIVQKAEIPQLSRVIKLRDGKVLIQINVDSLAHVNKLDLGRKRLSFWICILMHEILHCGASLSRNAFLMANGNIYREEQEIREMVAAATREMGALYREYRNVLKTIGLCSVEQEHGFRLCQVWGCSKRAIAKCNSCQRWLCEDHKPLEFHKPCKRNRPSSRLDFCVKTM